MSREILFRGRTIKTRFGGGTWIEGFFVMSCAGRAEMEPAIITGTEKGCFMTEFVDPATVGQFTGLCDKDGKKIFEGDIVTYPDGDGGYEYCDETINSGVVTWGDESALFYITNNYSAEFPDMWDRVDEMEVIGNIHDNEELLKEEAE